MSYDYAPAFAARPAVTRLTITAEFSDGTTVTCMKNAPEDAELDIRTDLRLPDISGGPEAPMFTLPPAPPPVRVTARLCGTPGHPVDVVLTTASRYDCQVPGCPSPEVRGSITDVQAHRQAHVLIRQWTEGDGAGTLQVSAATGQSAVDIASAAYIRDRRLLARYRHRDGVASAALDEDL